MKTKTTILFLCISSILCSQVSGYMGKRAVLEYSNYFFPAVIGPGYLKANKNFFSPGINSVHCANIDYTIKQRTNICLSVQYLHTGIKYKTDTAIYPYSNNYFYGGNYSTPAQLQSLNIGLGIKFFSRNALAPIGKYQKVELLMFFETVTYDYQNFYTNNNNGYRIKSNYGTGNYSYKNVAVTYTFGRQRVFFDRIILDYGLRIGIAPLYSISFILDDYRKSPEITFRDDSQLRILMQQLVNFHLGIGFLAF